MTRMICKNCGLEADDYIYCVECGSKMVELEQSGIDQESEAGAHDVPGQEESEAQVDQLEMPETWTDQGEQLQASEAQGEQQQAFVVQDDQLEMPEAWTDQGDESYVQDAQGEQLQAPEAWTDQGQDFVYHSDQIQQAEAQGYQTQTPDAWGERGQAANSWGGVSDTASYRNPVEVEPPVSSPVKSGTPKKSTIIIGATAAAATIALGAAIFVLGQPFKQPSNNPPQTSVAPQSQSPSSATNNGTNAGQTTQSPSNGVSSPTPSPQDNGSSSQNSSANGSNAEGREDTAHAGQQGQNQAPSGTNAGSGGTGNATKTDADNGNKTDTSNGNKTDSSNGNKTDSGNATKTDAGNGNKTDTSNGNKTDAGNGNKTDTSNGGSGGGTASAGGSTTSNQQEPLKLVAQSDTTPSRDYAGETSDIGNLANGGQLASSGSDIYYAKPEDGKEWVTKSIVRTQADGKKKDEIYKGSSDTKSIDNINAFKDRLVFTETGKDKTYVVSMDSKGGNKVVIDECDGGSLCQVSDGWVYYQHNGTVYRCDPFGQGQTEIRKVGDDQWYVVENLILTIEDDSTTIYMNFIGSKERLKSYTASNGCYIASVCFKSAHTLPILEKSKTGKACSVIEVNGNGAPVPRWSGEGDFEAISSYDDGITLLRKNAANDYSIFTLRGPDSDTPKYQTRDWDSELKSVANVKNKGVVRNLSSFSGNIAFASVNNNSKCGWNAIPVAGGDIRAL